MARIRSIKPEFWQDEKLTPLSPITRLLFLGLISLADDAGRVLDNPKRIDAELFSENDNYIEQVRSGLDELAALGRIERGRSESGQRILQIINWRKHQRIDKPNPNVLPPIACVDSRGSREGVANESREPREGFASVSTKDQDQERDQERDQEHEQEARANESRGSRESAERPAAPVAIPPEFDPRADEAWQAVTVAIEKSGMAKPSLSHPRRLKLLAAIDQGLKPGELAEAVGWWASSPESPRMRGMGTTIDTPLSDPVKYLDMARAPPPKSKAEAAKDALDSLVFEDKPEVRPRVRR